MKFISSPPIPWAAGTLLPLDVQEEASVAQCVETILSQAKRIDVLVNNGGITITGAIEELSLAQVKAVFETNWRGHMSGEQDQRRTTMES